jgi:hypothetical protein
MMSADDGLGTSGNPQVSAPPRNEGAEITRDRDMILGLERRLERGESDGKDMTIARLAVTKHYSAYAAEVVRTAGGNVQELKTLTDGNNMAPLRWSDGKCGHLD